MNQNEYEAYFDIEHLRFYNLRRDKSIKLNINDINYSLILNKYFDYKFEEDKKKSKSQKKYSITYKLNEEDKLKKYIETKINSIIEQYKMQYRYQEVRIPIKTSSRLIIGHGEVSVREVSIKLDYIYGIPMIPASSIKGAFRNYLNEKYSKVNREKNEYEESQIIKEIFGSEDKIGQLIFFDSYPENFTVGTDVMTPHYGAYYSNGSDPTDDLKPNPIKFPVVEKGAKFNIVVLSKQKIYTIDENNINIEEEFKNFLTEKPLGAKTSVGYGYFELI